MVIEAKLLKYDDVDEVRAYSVIQQKPEAAQKPKPTDSAALGAFSDLWDEDEDEPPTAYGRVGVCRECRRIIKDSERWGDGVCKECEG